MLVNFQSCWSVPEGKELLNIFGNDGASWEAHAFRFRIRGWILSGPGDLETFKVFRCLSTSSTVYWISLNCSSKTLSKVGKLSHVGNWQKVCIHALSNIHIISDFPITDLISLLNYLHTISELIYNFFLPSSLISYNISSRDPFSISIAFL
jgi:hypothetical protein